MALLMSFWVVLWVVQSIVWYLDYENDDNKEKY